MYGGHLLFDTYDSYGEIRVLAQGEKRLLSFGPGDEQSAGFTQMPHALVFDYTQAMLLSLLFAEPKKVLLLGLGAGSLATCLHYHYARSQLTVVELRQSVIDVAYRYFGLPRSKRLNVHCGEALDTLQGLPGQYDIIFSDIYLQEGMHHSQRNATYIAACARHLKPEGILVTNCWREHQEDNEVLSLLQSRFAAVNTCTTPDNNWLIFARQGSLEVQNSHKETAKQLSKQLGFSLNKHLKRFQRA